MDTYFEPAVQAPTPTTAATAVRRDSLLRAAAILLVAFSHAVNKFTFSGWFDGGMCVLMMVSGFSFAKLALAGGTAQRAVRTLTGFAFKLVAACLAIIVLTTPFRQTPLFTAYGLTDVLFRLPTWYGPVMASIALALAGLFLIPWVRAHFFGAPRTGSLLLLAAALVLHVVSAALWDAHVVDYHLPQLLAWIFVLGWVIFFLTNDLAPPLRTLIGRTVLVGLIAAVSAAIGWNHDNEGGYLVIACLVMADARPIRLPAGLAHVVNLVAQATFFIYLTSWIFQLAIKQTFQIAVAAHPAITPGFIASVLAMWILPVLASMALWVVWTATGRAFGTVCGPLRITLRRTAAAG